MADAVRDDGADDKLERVAACDLCGGRDFRLAREWTDRLLFGTERWKLVECTGCSLRFLDPRPTPAEIGAYYPADYQTHNDPPSHPKAWHRRVSTRDAAPLGWVSRARIHIKQDTSWYYFPRWRGDGRVLDIGCGNGARYLDILKALGWTTHGIDASPNAVAAAAAKGHAMKQGLAEADHFPAASMDVVTMWHSLEHTYSPRRALECAFRVLRPGGLLTLAVPNFGSLQAKMQGSYWPGVEVPRHLYQFTKKPLRRYLEETGFEIVRIRTRSGATNWPRAGRLALNRILHRRWQRDPKWLIEASEPLAMLGSLVRYFGVGSELRVLAQRPEER